MPTTRTVVKGTKYYCAPSRLQAGGLKIGHAVKLVPEPKNEADPNAVAIWTKHKPEKLGYISRDLAWKYCRMVAVGAIKSVHIYAIDSTDATAPRITILVDHNKLGDQGSLPASLAAEIPKTAGVYAIVNKKRNRWYVGSSVDMRARIKAHFKDLEIRSHHNPLLQQDYIAQVGVGFRAVVIAMASPAELPVLEKSEIRTRLADGQLLYNLSEDGQGGVPGPRFDGMTEQQSVSTREFKLLSRRQSRQEDDEHFGRGHPASPTPAHEQARELAWLPIAAIVLVLVWLAF